MGSLPVYPGPTKELSVNYGAGGEPFALANDTEDDLDPRDIWRLARAVEDHAHGTGRGLPINRIGTATAPQTPGDIQVSGDDFRWWAATAAAIYSAVNTTADQTVNGVKRLNQPLMLALQGAAPAAPGLGLGALYLGPGDKLYLRSGSGAPTGLGPPSMLAAPLSWRTTQGAGQAQLQEIALGSSSVWTLGFRPAGNDLCSLMSVAPFTCGQGVPITAQVTWTCPAGTGKVNWTLLARVTPVGGDLTQAWAQVATATADAPGGAWLHSRTAVAWTTGLPQPGDVVHLALQRNDATEAAAGAKYTGTASAIDVSVVYG